MVFSQTHVFTRLITLIINVWRICQRQKKISTGITIKTVNLLKSVESQTCKHPVSQHRVYQCFIEEVVILEGNISYFFLVFSYFI